MIVNRNTNKIYIVLNKDKKIYDSDQYAKKLNDQDEGPTINLGGGGKGKPSKGPAMDSGKYKLDKL